MSQDNHPHDTAPTPIHNSVGRKKGGNDEVHSVSDFIEKIAPILEECNGSEIFYRGHADISWKLQPSIFRKSNKEEKEDQSNGVGKEHLLFRDMVAHTPQSFSGCKSALDYLVQMQHYGLPTRLLDMTTNPLVALYFACQPTTDDALAGASAGAQAGVQVVNEALRVCVALSHTLSLVKSDADNHSIAHDITQAIVDTISVADVGVVEQIIAGVFDSAVIAEDTQGSFQGVNEIVAQAIVQAATVAGTWKATAKIMLVAALFIAVGRDGFDDKLFSRVGAVAGAMAGVSAEASQIAAAVAVAAEGISPIDAKQSVEYSVEFSTLLFAQVAAELGADLGARARAKDGVVYLFSVPEDIVKHYDSDTISVLANLAKCKISEQCSACLSVDEFNAQPDIKFLLHQIKGEKPHFLPHIQPCDLSRLFFVKAKHGNQRIANQMGAFLIFGLGVKQVKVADDAGEVTFLTKSEHIEVPVEWVKKKLVISKECKADILKELALLGITESYIYPGMEQYAKELKKKYEL